MVWWWMGVARTIAMAWLCNKWSYATRQNVVAWSHPMLRNYNKCPCRAPSLCRGVINKWTMMGEFHRNVILIPVVVVVINRQWYVQPHRVVWWCHTWWHDNQWIIIRQLHREVWWCPVWWCGDEWIVIRQPHRGCTFDSPGLPTIGGYPGEQGVRDATPLGVVLFHYSFSQYNVSS